MRTVSELKEVCRVDNNGFGFFAEKVNDPSASHVLKLPQLPNVTVTGDTTIAEILAMLYTSGNSLATPQVTLDYSWVSLSYIVIFLLGS